MGDLVVPVVLFAVVGLAVIALVVSRHRPVSTWGEELRDLREVAKDKPASEIVIIPEDVHLSDLLVRDDSSVYTGTESFQGLVGMVEKAMDAAESRTQAVRTRTKVSSH